MSLKLITPIPTATLMRSELRCGYRDIVILGIRFVTKVTGIVIFHITIAEVVINNISEMILSTNSIQIKRCKFN